MPLDNDQVAAARREISLAKRDLAGFVEGDSPNITEEQYRWLSYRMSHASDNAAALAIQRDDEEEVSMEWLYNVEEWRQDPNFVAFEQIALGNKREGTRQLLVHQAGKVLRVMSALLDSKDPKIQLRAVTLWSRQMGLLIDKLTLVDKDDLVRLAERMMTPARIEIIDGPSIIDAEFSEPDARPPRDPALD